MVYLDTTRIELSRHTTDEVKSALGQYLTPDAIAQFMASLFSPDHFKDCAILDPGAGVGSLSAALVNRINSFDHQTVSLLTTVELDSMILPYLKHTIGQLAPCIRQCELVQGDFLEQALNWLQFEPQKRFSHIILNPPYKKINSASIQRKLLRQAGIETVNLYSGFVALCIQLLKEQGELVAIIPRSFCNGPYYKPFRKLLLKWTVIEQIHLFGSRKSNFSEDNVLQENVIIKLTRKSPTHHMVKLSWSTDLNLSDYHEYILPSTEVVKPDDTELFIRIPEELPTNCSTRPETVNCSLKVLDLSVSTGPVVDFRARQFLSAMPQSGTAPLIYPLHLHFSECKWPQQHAKKANGIFINEQTRKMLFPTGYYCVVKRFSSKEEPRRITASVVSPDDFQNSQLLGFENHLNIFHQARKGLEKNIAYGLMVFLNSKVVDRYFRTFNGHTQVNATDLRQMHYPSRKNLEALGQWALNHPKLTIAEIDNQVEEILCKNHATNIS